MAQKTHPKGFRLGITHNYSTQWFTKKSDLYQNWVFEDTQIRQYLAQVYPNIIDIIIQRAPEQASSFSNKSSQCFVRVILAPTDTLAKFSPYGQKVIRMKGSMKTKPAPSSFNEANDVKKIEAILSNRMSEKVQICIEKSQANDTAQAIAVQLQNALFLAQKQNNLKFKTILKKMKTDLMANKSFKGFRIELSGRSAGSLMAGREYVSHGQMPRQTIRIPIDYISFDFRTKVGLIGAKIWVN